MDYDSNYQAEWDAKSNEFYNKLVAFCEEMYMDEPAVLEEAIGMLDIHVKECNRKIDNDIIVDEFIAQLDEL